MFRAQGCGLKRSMALRGSAKPRRRDEALAFVIDRLVRTGSSPTFEEIGGKLGVSKTRAQELVEQLIVNGVIEKVPGAQRALRVRDVTHARHLVDQFARSLGWAVASPLGALEQPSVPTAVKPLPHVQLPVLPAFEHFPDND